jgi:hypothetical protein
MKTNKIKDFSNFNKYGKKSIFIESLKVEITSKNPFKKIKNCIKSDRIIYIDIC